MINSVVSFLVVGGIIGQITTYTSNRVVQQKTKCFGNICVNTESIKLEKSDIPGKFTKKWLVKFTGTNQFSNGKVPVMMEVDCPNLKFRITKLNQNDRWLDYPPRWTAVGITGSTDLNKLIQYTCQKSNSKSIIENSTPKGKAQPKISSLSDGNYRFCDYPNNQLKPSSGLCFIFHKTSENLVGLLYAQTYEDYNICIQGKVNNNTVSGIALEKEFFIKDKPTLDPKFRTSQLNYLGLKKYLQVGNGIIYTSFLERSGYSKKVKYSRALLNLNQFYHHNADTIDPPKNCSR